MKLSAIHLVFGAQVCKVIPEKRRRGFIIRRSSESRAEHFVFCSERIVLECGCGEIVVLLGHEDDWYSEGRTVFECECGEMLTLADRVDKEESAFGEGLDEENLSVRDLLRNLRSPDGQ